jgi:hypothetical protein
MIMIMIMNMNMVIFYVVLSWCFVAFSEDVEIIVGSLCLQVPCDYGSCITLNWYEVNVLSQVFAYGDP